MTDQKLNLEKQLEKMTNEEQEKVRKTLYDIWSKKTKINLLFTGTSLCGKSTTITALINESLKNTGVSYPEDRYPIINSSPFPTMNMTNNKEDFLSYEINNITYWETPGFGQSLSKDEEILKKIEEQMVKTDTAHYYTIDLAIVIHDSSFSDQEITHRIFKHLSQKYQKRVILIYNKKDICLNSDLMWHNRYFYSAIDGKNGSELLTNILDSCKATPAPLPIVFQGSRRPTEHANGSGSSYHNSFIEALKSLISDESIRNQIIALYGYFEDSQTFLNCIYAIITNNPKISVIAKLLYLIYKNIPSNH